MPSQTEINPKQNVSAITLRTDKELASPEIPDSRRDQVSINEKRHDDMEIELEKDRRPMKEPIVIQPPFPSRLAGNKKAEADSDILDVFRKVVINIPLLNMINQVPRYKKFLKELCTTRQRL